MNPFSSFGRPALVPLVFTAVALLVLGSPLSSFAQQPNACTGTPAGSDPTSTVCVSRMIVAFNGTSPDNQFYVSWRSQKAETGQVRLTDGTTFEDVRGASYRGPTHYVQVNNLDAKTTYLFDIVSGGTTYDANGDHWSVRTGPAIQPDTPYTIIGRVQNPDGSDADGVVVFAQVRDADNQGTPGRSALVSGLIVLADGGNFFSINLSDARTQNNTQDFSFNPAADRVLITAFSAQGTARQVFAISDLHPPAAPPSLILSSSGIGTAATATATLPAPTSTATFSPTPTGTATLSPSSTATLAPTLAPPTETIELAATETAQAEPGGTEAPTESFNQSTPATTLVAEPAGQEVEPHTTRVFGGVPEVVPPASTNSTPFAIIALAVVLFVGALLLSLAAFFVTRR